MSREKTEDQGSFRCRRFIKGFDYNPLLAFNRNSLCFCNSGLKFKKCCLRTMPRGLPTEIVKHMSGKSFGAQASILVEFLREIHQLQEAKRAKDAEAGEPA